MPNVLVCIKRVPGSSGQILLTPDASRVDTRHVGHTVSPHEECAVEAAVQVVAAHGGSATVLTLGAPEALEQLRESLALGVGSAIHLEADGEPYGPADVAAAIAEVARGRAGRGEGFDLLLFGNDAADTGDFQVGIRVGYLLGLPVLTGIRSFEITGGTVVATGDGPDGAEFFEVPLPAVLAIKEGEITPRYPSIPGRLKAKKAPVDVITPAEPVVGTGRRRLVLLAEPPSAVQILGTGPGTAPAVVDLFEQLGVVSR